MSKVWLRGGLATVVLIIWWPLSYSIRAWSVNYYHQPFLVLVYGMYFAGLQALIHFPVWKSLIIFGLVYWPMVAVLKRCSGIWSVLAIAIQGIGFWLLGPQFPEIAFPISPDMFLPGVFVLESLFWNSILFSFVLKILIMLTDKRHRRSSERNSATSNN